MKGTQNLFRRFLALFSARATTTVIAILSTPVIVRLLGPSDYGNYAAVLSMYSLYMIPISAGITEGIQKFVAEPRDVEYWHEHVIRFYGIIAVALATIGVAGLVLFAGTDLPGRFFDAEFAAYFYFIAMMVFVGQFRAMGYRTVLGFSLEHISAPLDVTRKFVTVGLGIVMVVVGYGVTGMLVGHIAANLVVALVAGVVIARRVSIRRVFRAPESFPYRELLSFNAFNIVLVLLFMSLYHVDIIMLRSLTDGESTGFYKGALALAEYLWFVPIVLQNLLLHSSSNLWEEDRVERIAELAGRITRYVALLVILLAIGLATLADRVVPLYYGQEFTVAVEPLLFLIPGAVGFAVARPLRAITQGSGRIKVLAAAVAVAAVLNFGLNALFIPRYGMTGAAVATSIGYGSMFVLLVWVSWRLGFDPLVDLRPLRIAVTAAVSAVPIVVVDGLIVNDVLALAVVPALGLLVYSATALATGALDVDEIVEILGKFPGTIGNFVDAHSS